MVRARVDGNQKEVVAALRKSGAVVFHVHTIKNLFDILVAYNGKLIAIEIKDGTLSPSARKLTPGELKCKAALESVGVKYNVVHSIPEALALLI
tara:strand:+ start:3290 stop:3571 length:282 start_codon:yes stop_codon:yes gene_type:complete